MTHYRILHWKSGGLIWTNLSINISWMLFLLILHYAFTKILDNFVVLLSFTMFLSIQNPVSLKHVKLLMFVIHFSFVLLYFMVEETAFHYLGCIFLAPCFEKLNKYFISIRLLSLFRFVIPTPLIFRTACTLPLCCCQLCQFNLANKL